MNYSASHRRQSHIPRQPPRHGSRRTPHNFSGHLFEGFPSPPLLSLQHTQWGRTAFSTIGHHFILAGRDAAARSAGPLPADHFFAPTTTASNSPTALATEKEENGTAYCTGTASHHGRLVILQVSSSNIWTLKKYAYLILQPQEIVELTWNGSPKAPDNCPLYGIFGHGFSFQRIEQLLSKIYWNDMIDFRGPGTYCPCKPFWGAESPFNTSLNIEAISLIARRKCEHLRFILDDSKESRASVFQGVSFLYIAPACQELCSILYKAKWKQLGLDQWKQLGSSFVSWTGWREGAHTV